MCWNINNLLPEQGSGQVFFQKGSEREGPGGATQTKIFYIPSNQG